MTKKTNFDFCVECTSVSLHMYKASVLMPRSHEQGNTKIRPELTSILVATKK